MAKFRVTVADEAGSKLYDETIEAPGPTEACIKAAEDARVAAEAAAAPIPAAAGGADASGDVGAIG